jgi:site-specific DNA recombinase
MSNAAIYARVSSARQKEQQTISSQTAALQSHAEDLGLDVPAQWVFEDDGQSGASLVRPALERLRDLVCQVPVDVLLVYSPDRLARKYAYQALLIEEFAKAGTTVVFLKGRRGDSPEDALLTQFQGMIAEYERAQILERTRRGKTHRARAGTVNVLSGAPFGYRYVRKNDHAEACYEIVPHEAAIVAELFARYADGGVAIGALARWLSGLGVPNRTGKTCWDRSVIWAMLRNPAYAGRACFGKTMRTDQTAGLNRTARLTGRATPRNYTVIERPREDWIEIGVPALVAEDTWERVQRRLADNKRYASRNSTNPSLLQGICACAGCGYAYYRTSTRTTNKIIYYYRCLGSDNYRYEHGRVCANKPVRADYLDSLVWDHIATLLADPTLIRAEITRRLAHARTADPATVQRQRLETGLIKATEAIKRLIGAYQEQLITLDELRSRMPELRNREAGLRQQIEALDAQLADREIYLTLADSVENFLTGLKNKAATASIAERQRVLRLLVKDVLVSPDKITIRHSIPVRHKPTSTADTDQEGESSPNCQLRWRSQDATLGCAGGGVFHDAVLTEDTSMKKRFHHRQDTFVPDPRSHPVHQGRMVDHVEACLDVTFQHPLIRAGGELVDLSNRIVGPPPRTEAIRAWLEVRLEDRLEHQFEGRLHGAVPCGRDAQPSQLGAARLRDHPFPHREWSELPSFQILPKLRQEPLLRGEDRLRPKPVDPRRPLPSIAPDPRPRHNEDGRVTHEVEQVVEPAIRIIDRPLMQLGLDP